MIAPELGGLAPKEVEGPRTDHECATIEVSRLAHMVPMDLVSERQNDRTKLKDTMITYMRVDDIVNIIRCQATSFQALDDVRMCSIWLAGDEMLLYRLRIAPHVSA